MLSKLIDEGYGVQDAASILGRHPVALARLFPAGHKPTKKLVTPYGLTDDTYALRARLGGIIASMGMSREKIGEITGLNKRESFRAERRPYNHDWTLSQIERTLAFDTTRRTRLQILELDAKDETQ